MLTLSDLSNCGSNITIAVGGRELSDALRAFAQEIMAAQQPATKQLLTYREVAQEFKKTERTINAWVKRGVLSPIRVGGATLFDPADVERLKKQKA